mmetsp:Transcript_22044/g.37504  ORF Transcript_22044/g.37504 Transcript_22044/m.37504 type:complete len:97 (+) Transcript_22044:51-341(+)
MVGQGRPQQCLPFMERLYLLGSGSIGMLFGASIRMAFPSFPLTMLLREHHQPVGIHISTSSSTDSNLVNISSWNDSTTSNRACIRLNPGPLSSNRT